MKPLRTALAELAERTRAHLVPSPASPIPAPGEILWLDHPDAEEMIPRRTRDPRLAAHAREIIQTGITRIERAVSGSLCDRLMEEFHDYCRQHPESAEFADSHGYHSRLVNFHMVSPSAREIGMNRAALAVLDFLLGYRAAAYASLTFERGTEQAFHRDSPFFHTQPTGFFFGVWTALEDVHPDAGPLSYYPGGHRIFLNQRPIGERHRGDPDRRAKMFADYTVAVAAGCEAAGLKKESVLLRKGDILVWHPTLPHSGSRIADRSRTRKSIVFHYVPEGMQIQPLEFYFDPAMEAQAKTPPTYRSSHGRLYFEQTPPQFLPNL